MKGVFISELAWRRPLGQGCRHAEPASVLDATPTQNAVNPTLPLAFAPSGSRERRGVRACYEFARGGSGDLF